MNKCKSILRWVGSKKRIINEIIENLPEEMNDYYEPFLEVVYLYVPNKSKSYINDNNKDLISLYKYVKNHKEMIKLLEKLYKEYMSNDDDGKKEYYLEKRERFNKIKGKYDLERAVLYIFINKTCYNGIRNLINMVIIVQDLKLHNPNICDLKNIENLYNNLK